VNAYQRIFGSGPLGLAASAGLFLAAVWLERRLPDAPLLDHVGARVAAFGVACLAGTALFLWSLLALPVEARGRRLVTGGAYRFVRHPLYAAFLTFFDFGLALFLDHAVYLAWAVLLHPLWHLLVRGEERRMAEAFGAEWDAYARRTGRFVPRLASLRR